MHANQIHITSISDLGIKKKSESGFNCPWLFIQMRFFEFYLSEKWACLFTGRNVPEKQH